MGAVESSEKFGTVEYYSKAKSSSDASKDWALANGYVIPTDKLKDQWAGERGFVKPTDELKDKWAKERGFFANNEVDAEAQKRGFVKPTDQLKDQWAKERGFFSKNEVDAEAQKRGFVKPTDQMKDKWAGERGFIKKEACPKPDYAFIANQHGYLRADDVLRGLKQQGTVVYQHVNRGGYYSDPIFIGYNGPVTGLKGNSTQSKLLGRSINASIKSRDISSINVAPFTDIWFYSNTNFTGEHLHIHNGTGSVWFINLTDHNYNDKASSMIVKTLPDNKIARDNDRFVNRHELGRLKEFVGVKLSFKSVGNGNFAIDDSGTHQENKDCHLWTFSNLNQNQQFWVNPRGQLLLQTNQGLCLYAKSVSNAAQGLIQRNAQAVKNDNKSWWNLTDSGHLFPADQARFCIDIDSAVFKDGSKLHIWERNNDARGHQRWTPIILETFSINTLKNPNDLATIIASLLILICFIYIFKHIYSSFINDFTDQEPFTTWKQRFRY